MLIKPRLVDIRIIGFYLGRLTIGIGICMAMPLVFAFLVQEFAPALDFLISILICFTIGQFLSLICFTNEDLNWMQGMVVVSLGWLVITILGAVPLYLSGHWKTFLDACFDAMSGFSTTGLVLVQDLDHLSLSCNLWRHLIMFIGGQGIVVIALTFLVKGTAGAFRMYAGEGRDERVLPNIIQTARFIWLVSLTYLVLCTTILAIAGRLEGLRWGSSFFQSTCLFMAGFDTGGFAPHDQNIIYYHSLPMEIVTMYIMTLGAINFNLHYILWTKSRKEIFRNLETTVFFLSVTILFFIAALSLSYNLAYNGTLSLFRRGFFQLISAHTTTGFTNLYVPEMSKWPHLALAAIIIAMAFGGAVCSTTGAIKSLRIGLIFKAFLADTKRLMLPDKAVFVARFHHLKERFLEDKLVKSAALITLAYIILYMFGALVGTAYGYPFLESLFESTSAAANVGLSCGITNAAMPNGLKLVYIFQMWAGRLEFMSIFVLLGLLIAAIKGK